MKKNICIVIPCYKVSKQIIKVISSKELNIVDHILVIDDKCPENSGKIVEKLMKKNKKIKVLFNKKNEGVGGATIRGYKYALKKKYNKIIKVDGDNQHNLKCLGQLIHALDNNYDFSKGFRKLTFFSAIKYNMPLIRLFGALTLTILTRINTNNYELKDACHGLIGIKKELLKKINLNSLQKNYLFEQDMIFKVTMLRGKIFQFKSEVSYKDENSSLKPINSIIPFFIFHLKKFFSKYS